MSALVTKQKSSEFPELFCFVGEPGIEPGPHGPKPRTLPLCYTPCGRTKQKSSNFVASIIAFLF